MRYGIIADDLTGSCDVAGRLTHLGYRPVVQLRAAGSRRVKFDACSAVVVVNARSRASSQDGAVALVRLAAEDLERAGRTVIYYKMDSTLRGFWPEELNALALLLKPERVLICPAFPARGRVCRSGLVEIRQEEWKQLHSFAPTIGSRDLRSSLKEQVGYRPDLVGLEVLRQGQSGLREAVAKAKTRYVVFDATRERDLEAIGKALRNFAGRILWAGSAGLVRYVLSRLAQPESGPGPTPERPWLLIQGSRQQISHEQFHRLESDDAILSIRFNEQAGRKALRRWYDTVLEALAARRHVAVTVPRDFGFRLPEEFADFLQRLFRGLGRGHWLGGILVSGGTTAESVCDVLRVSAVQVIGEVSPGIAWSTLLDGNWRGLPLITKAGGFGRPDEVREILEKISA